MLETTILDQVRSVFQHLEARYVFHITYHPGHEQAQELIGFLKDVASCSDKLSCRMSEIENPVLEFTLLKDDVETGIKFRGIPGGHEFTSLLLAVLNADGKGKNLPDEAIRRRIRALQGDISLQTYVSLTCTNCPDVVQALNIIALLNPHVTHEMVDGALNQEEVDALKIQAVPSVYANGKAASRRSRFFRRAFAEAGRSLRQCSARGRSADRERFRRAGIGRRTSRSFRSHLLCTQGPTGGDCCRAHRRTGKGDGRHRKPYLRAADYWCRTCQRTPHTYRALSDRDFRGA